MQKRLFTYQPLEGDALLLKPALAGEKWPTDCDVPAADSCFFSSKFIMCYCFLYVFVGAYLSSKLNYDFFIHNHKIE